MKNEFDHILNQLISGMPVHSADPDTWQKINNRLDHDISMSRLREKMNKKEHSPEPETWSYIETELNRLDHRKRFFLNFSMAVTLSLLVIITTVSIFLFYHEGPQQKADSNTDRNNIEKTSFLKNSSIPGSKSNEDDNTENNLKIVKHNTPSLNNPVLTGSKIPAVAQDNPHFINDSSGKFSPSVDFDKSVPNPNNNGCSITGKLIWWMPNKGNMSLYLFDEKGTLVKTIFEKEKFEEGEQYYNFKLVNCNIEKGKKYTLRLMNRKAMITELECIAE
jgi:hypothetical protein